MKQVNRSLIYVFVLCVLIGYFEPANAQLGSTVTASSTANMALVPSNPNCAFWPNPVNQGVIVNVFSTDQPTGGYLTNTLMGGFYPASIITTGQPVDPSEVENNCYLEPIIASTATLNNAVDSTGGSDTSSAGATSLGGTLVSDSGTAISDPTLGAAVTDTTTASDSLAGTVVSVPTSPLNSTAPGGSTSAPGEVENNCYLEPIVYVSTLGLPVVPDGTYILVVTGQSGNSYTSQITITN